MTVVSPSSCEITTCCDDGRHITTMHAPKWTIDAIVDMITGARNDEDNQTGEYGYTGRTGGYWHWNDYIHSYWRNSDCTLRIHWRDYSASHRFYDMFGNQGSSDCSPYGNFFSTEKQTASTSPSSISFNNIKYSRGVYLCNGTQIKVLEPGLYKFGYSCQINENHRMHGKMYSNSLPYATLNSYYYNYGHYYYFFYYMQEWMRNMFSGVIDVTIRGKAQPKGSFWITKNGSEVLQTKRTVANDLTVYCEHLVQMEKNDYIEVKFAKADFYDYRSYGGFAGSPYSMGYSGYSGYTGFDAPGGTHTFDPTIDEFSIVNNIPTTGYSSETMPSIILNAYRITDYLPETIT